MNNKLIQFRRTGWHFFCSHRYITAFIFALIISTVGTYIFYSQVSYAKEIQQGIAQEIIRFHVLANSDTEEDQALKMEVKEYAAEYITELIADADGLEETRACLQSNLEELCRVVTDYISNKGYDYAVNISLVRTYFPEKTYGDLTFPAGEYEALQIKLGEASGQNWWCVLYPNLCFIDATYTVVDDEQKEELQNILTEEEYDAISSGVKLRIRFKYLENLFK